VERLSKTKSVRREARALRYPGGDLAKLQDAASALQGCISNLGVAAAVTGARTGEDTNSRVIDMAQKLDAVLAGKAAEEAAERPRARRRAWQGHAGPRVPAPLPRRQALGGPGASPGSARGLLPPVPLQCVPPFAGPRREAAARRSKVRRLELGGGLGKSSAARELLLRAREERAYPGGYLWINMDSGGYCRGLPA